jgi:hypothetical protein
MRASLLRRAVLSLLVAVFVGAGPAWAVQDVAARDVLGFTLGMPAAEADRVAAVLPAVEEIERKSRKPAATGGGGVPRRIDVRFHDGRFLSVGFAVDAAGASRVSAIHLVYQRSSYTAGLFASLKSALPRPDVVRSEPPVEIAAWGGTEVVEGAVTPAAGATATLLIEHLRAQHVDITLRQVAP